MQTEHQRLMEGALGQWLSEQNTMREAARIKARNRWIIGSAILAAALWGVHSLVGSHWILPAVGGIGVAAWGFAPLSAAKRAIKIGINRAIAQALGLSYEHDVEPGAEFQAAKTYGLVPSYDRDSFEDRWYGTIEGHRFNLYEVHLQERRNSGKKQRWVTVFRGAIIDMGFGRDFHSTTLLQRAGKHRSWLGLGGRKDYINFRGHRLDYVDQVHPEFEDVFEVWSDDQVEARTLIHPTYVEHLIALERAFHSDAVRALFHRGDVIVAVESGDLFESCSLDQSDDEYAVAKATEQFNALRSIALAINQNDRGQAMGN